VVKGFIDEDVPLALPAPQSEVLRIEPAAVVPVETAAAELEGQPAS
jgi:hypothetical protein